MIYKKYLGLFAIVCLIGIANPGILNAQADLFPPFKIYPIDLCDDVVISVFCNIAEDIKKEKERQKNYDKWQNSHCMYDIAVNAYVGCDGVNPYRK